MMRKAILAGALGLALATAGAVTAHAEKADEVIRFHDEIEMVDADLTALCGYDVNLSVDARGTVRLFDDGRVHANEHGSFTISANGRSLTNSWAGLFKGQSTETVDEDAGTVTISWDNSNFGLHEKWVGDEGGVFIMDRGQAHFVGMVVLDIETGEPLSFEETIDTSGPHPILEQGGLDPSGACDYFDS